MSPLVLHFAAGALTACAPCVLPLLPMVAGSALQAHALGPVALATGLTLGFAATGLAVLGAASSLGLDAEAARMASALILVLLGAWMLAPALRLGLPSVLAPLATWAQRVSQRAEAGSMRGQFFIGLLLGVIWSPCVGPVLGATIALAGQDGSLAEAGGRMLMFGLGASTPLLAAAYGLRRFLRTNTALLVQLGKFGKNFMGVACLALGAAVALGIDKSLESHLTALMPAAWIDFVSAL